MTKKNKTPWDIFLESIGLYFSNFKQFVKYMTFPVLGQILGLALVFICTYLYTKSLPDLIEKHEMHTLVLFSILIAIPGLVIFLKAFWEYLIAYGAINSMLENMLKSGKVYDFDAHTELIKRRSLSFVGLWLLFGIIYVLAPIPIFWIPALIAAIYFVLLFQVFTFEPEQSPIGCLKRSFNLIKGNVAWTALLMLMVGVLTYDFIPRSVNILLGWSGLSKTIASSIAPVIAELPINELNHILSYLYIPALKVDVIAAFTVTVIISQILIQYTLPLRSILWGMWYKKLCGEEPRNEKKKRVSKAKKPSEILMEESHKKYGAKKIDRNILKRAMEKDEE